MVGLVVGFVGSVGCRSCCVVALLLLLLLLVLLLLLLLVVGVVDLFLLVAELSSLKRYLEFLRVIVIYSMKKIHQNNQVPKMEVLTYVSCM